MNTTLLYAGVGCIIAAIVGGGMKALGIEIPPLNSRQKQVLLALFGAILIVFSLYGPNGLLSASVSGGKPPPILPIASELKDEQTGLTWKTHDSNISSGLMPGEAGAYCAGLTSNDKDRVWRLPSMDELRAIAASSATKDPNASRNTRIALALSTGDVYSRSDVPEARPNQMCDGIYPNGRDDGSKTNFPGRAPNIKHGIYYFDQEPPNQESASCDGYKVPAMQALCVLELKSTN